jgi:hypothetical protein
VVVTDVADVPEVYAASIFGVKILTMKIEAAYTSETSATSTTTTQCNNPRTEKSASVINHRKYLNSSIYLYFFAYHKNHILLPGSTKTEEFEHGKINGLLDLKETYTGCVDRTSI